MDKILAVALCAAMAGAAPAFAFDANTAGKPTLFGDGDSNLFAAFAARDTLFDAPANAAKTLGEGKAPTVKPVKQALAKADCAERKVVLFPSNDDGACGEKPVVKPVAAAKPEVAAPVKTAAVKVSAGKGKPYGQTIAKYAASYGVPVSLAHAVISVESNYRSNARGAAGEIGLMQVKLSTARMMGYSGSAKGLYNPETNIRYGMKYLAKAHELGGGSVCGTILKYNAGHGAKRMNPVSASYCSKVKRRMGA
jgi:soluble lytic murein transglycosylase-like protein